MTNEIGQAVIAGAALTLVMSVQLPASAAETAKQAAIVAAVSGKSLQGSMLKDTFVEYYAPDGTIKGKGYSGKWRVSGDTMCFKYGDKPEGRWQLEINGPALTFYKDGKVDGAGILVEGNPHNF